MDPAAGRILIVDDDAALLKVMDSYLSRLGYRVDACSSAAEAWALVEPDPSLYAGALVDLNMPGMRGEELARRILDSNASIRLVPGRLSIKAFRAERTGRRVEVGTLPACPYFSYVIVNRRRPASAAQPMREFAC